MSDQQLEPVWDATHMHKMQEAYHEQRERAEKAEARVKEIESAITRAWPWYNPDYDDKEGHLCALFALVPEPK